MTQIRTSLNQDDCIVNESLESAVDRLLGAYFEAHEGTLPSAGLYARVIREVEKPMIRLALDATGGNQAQAARVLGLNRNTLRKKITELNLHHDPKRAKSL